ncbi:hypothetical protein ACFL57_05225 [Candidatus Margulisiibacteriota bacterium]
MTLPPSPFRKKLVTNISILLLFLFLSLLNTYPLVTHMNTHQLGDGGDGVEFLWNLWWTKTALTEQQALYHTDYLFHPHGTDLYLHSLSPFNGLASIPLQYLFDNNLILAYNILAILHFTLAGFGMFLLVSYFTKNRFAAIAGGYIFAFCPYMMGHSLGHLNLMSTGMMPLFILYFLKFHKDPSIKHMGLSSLFLILNTLCSLYYGVLMLFFAFVYEAYYLAASRWRTKPQPINAAFITRLLSIFIIFGIVLLPVLPGMYNASQSGQFTANHDTAYWSADLFSFFVPGNLSGISTLFRPFGWWNSIMHNSHTGAENQNFFGYIVLILLIFTLTVFLRRKTKNNFVFTQKYYAVFFLILALVTSVFALGTQMKLLGNVFDIKLPYYYTYKILPLVSVPGRFTILTVIALSILTAIGITILSGKLGTKKNLVCIAILFLISIEFMSIPYPLTAYPVPEFYRSLAQENGDFAIYDLSHRTTGDRYLYASGRHMFYQTIHHKKITSGRLSRNNLSVLDKAMNGPALADLAKLNIKYVVLPADSTAYVQGLIKKLEAKGYAVAFKDLQIIVYEITL